ncbi:hypothetical protein, partial [Escherichia coli]|uniref:hypothetical protein n=1 Tax=Escherichia coli TaxID=562 RepID=UPI00142E694C
MSRHKPSTLILIEARGVDYKEAMEMEELVIFNKTNKTRIMQKMQVMDKVEEIIDKGGALEIEVDGNKEIISIEMVARF